MPLTEGQLAAIETMLNGPAEGDPDNLNTRINAIVNAREDVQALVRIHADVPDEAAATILTNAKTRVVTAATEIVELLT